MKYNFICEGGKHSNYYTDRNSPPLECKDCFEKFDFSNVVEIADENKKEIVGLTIIYQINQQRLEISTLHKTILGRENFGANIFSQIFFNGKLVVSRKHCSIEFREGNFYILDEGSLNGTSYGVNKISCKNSPQIIKDKSIFYIGEEAFLAHINYQELNQEESPQVEEVTNQVVKAIKEYRCRGCGNNFEKFSDDCPNCDRYNSLIPIYE